MCSVKPKNKKKKTSKGRAGKTNCLKVVEKEDRGMQWQIEIENLLIYELVDLLLGFEIAHSAFSVPSL